MITPIYKLAIGIGLAACLIRTMNSLTLLSENISKFPPILNIVEVIVFGWAAGMLFIFLL